MTAGPQLAFAGLLALVLASCGFDTRFATATFEPVPAGPLGPILQGQAVGAPPIECRELALDRCRTVGLVDANPTGQVGGVAFGDIQRVIVSCEGQPCTPVGGAFRIDVLRSDGTTVEVGRGVYGEADQPAPPG